MNTVVKVAELTTVTADPYRIVTISANLLPVEIIESRRSRKTRRAVLAALVVLLVVLTGWYAAARYQTSVARSDLRATERTAQQLAKQQDAYADLVGIQTQSTAISGQLATLLAEDLRWSSLLSSLRAAATGGVVLTDVTGALSDATGVAGPDQSFSQFIEGSDARPVGTVTVTGTGPSKAAVAAYVDSVATITGLAHPLLGGASVDGGTLHFTVRLDITTAALGGRYSPTTADGGTD